MSHKQLACSASFASPAPGRERRGDMREYLERMERMFEDVQAQKEQVLARTSLRTPGRFTPVRRATDPGSPTLLRSRIPHPGSPSVLRQPPRRTDTGFSSARVSRDWGAAGRSPLPANLPPASGSQHRSFSSTDWAVAAATARAMSPLPSAAAEAPARPAGPGVAAKTSTPQRALFPARPGGTTAAAPAPALPGGAGATLHSQASHRAAARPQSTGGDPPAPLPRSLPQPAAEAHDPIAQCAHLYTEEEVLMQRYNPLREGLQRLALSGSTPRENLQPAAAGSRQGARGAAGAAPSASLDSTASPARQWRHLAIGRASPEQLPRRSCTAWLEGLPAQSCTPVRSGSQFDECSQLAACELGVHGMERQFSGDDDVLMASPVIGATVLHNEAEAAGFLHPEQLGEPELHLLPGLPMASSPGSPPQQYPLKDAAPAAGAGPYAHWRQACTPPHVPRPPSASPASGRLRPCATTPLSVASHLTTPDRDQRYCSPSVQHSAAAGKGTPTPGHLTQLVVMNTAYSPGMVTSVLGGEGADEGAQQGLTPTRLAFASGGSCPGTSQQQEREGALRTASPAHLQQQCSPDQEAAPEGQAVQCAGNECGSPPEQPGLQHSTIRGPQSGCAAEAAAPPGGAQGGGPNAPEVETRGTAPGSSSLVAELPGASAAQNEGGQAAAAARPPPADVVLSGKATLASAGCLADAPALLVAVRVGAGDEPGVEDEAGVAAPPTTDVGSQQQPDENEQGAGEIAPPAARPGSAKAPGAFSRLAALARLKCRSMTRQASQAAAAPSCAAPEPAQPSASPPATSAGPDDSLAALKLRRHVLRSVSTSPAKPGVQQVGGEPDGGEEAPQCAEALIAAHRPCSQWDSAISPEEAGTAGPGSSTKACSTAASAAGLGSVVEAAGGLAAGPGAGNGGGTSPAAAKPFLRRRSQAVVPQKLPDYSQVRPRTQSHIDSNLLPVNRCGTPKGGPGEGFFGAGGHTPGSSRPTTPTVPGLHFRQQPATSRHPATPPVASLTSRSGARGSAAQSAARPSSTPTSRPPWGSARTAMPKRMVTAAAVVARERSREQQHSARTTPFSPPGLRRHTTHVYQASDLMNGARSRTAEASYFLDPMPHEAYQDYQPQSFGGGMARGALQREAAGRGQRGDASEGPLDDLLGHVDRLLLQVEQCIKH